MLHSQAQGVNSTLGYMLIDHFKCLSCIIGAVVDLELGFYAGSNPAGGLPEICDGENR